jgi:hypothetical protein
MNVATDWSVAFPGLVLFTAVFAFAIRIGYLKRRRRRSLRREGDGTYVWIELDGSPARSGDDPRDRWDAEDAADGDGDGGGD